MIDLEEVTVKSLAIETETDSVLVLDKVLGAVPVAPVMVRVKVAGLGTAVQLTVKTVPETLAVQPVGAPLEEKATVLENPLIEANDSAEELLPLPTIETTTLREDGLAETEKSTTWNETELDCMFCTGVPPLPVTVTV